MAQEENKYSDNRPGRDALIKYRAHGGGIELFRAYVERRAADKDCNQEKHAKLLHRLNGSNGVPFKEFEEIGTDLLRLQILDELDPIIRDLLTFCDNQPKVDDQLVNLRSALRIGKGHAPIDSSRAEIRWKIELWWINAFLQMGDTNIYRSENDIAEDIVNVFGVSKSTAFNHWRDKKEREPWQAKWANEITRRAKSRKMAGKNVRAAPAKKVKTRTRITFGKGRAIL